MASKKNKVLTLKVGEIEKNPILALSTGEKEVGKYKRVTKTYGNVTPAIVGINGNAYRILAGQAGLESCVQNGIREMPVIVAAVNEEAEQMKLALLLSTVRQEGGPLSEGAFIDVLITRHGVTRRELTTLLKKSKSWVSKRQSLYTRLSENVKAMVKADVICARTAEEIAKLPEDKQLSFASVVVRDGLSKTDATKLVSLFTREDTNSVTQEAILNTPLAVLDVYPTASIPRRKEKRSLAERLAANIGFVIRLISELKGLLAKADIQHINIADLNNLRSALKDLSIVLTVLSAGVSPGKPEEGVAS